MVSEKEAFYWWFTGFMEGHGTFVIVVNRRKDRPPSISARAQIYIHKGDLPLLQYMQKETGIGSIYIRKGNIAVLQTAKKDDVKKLIKIFDEHPFRSVRMRKNFELFKEGFEILLRRDERRFKTDEEGKKLPKLTVDEIRRLEEIRNSMNLYCGTRHSGVLKKYHDSLLDLF